jgi:hypothetical protein
LRSLLLRNSFAHRSFSLLGGLDILSLTLHVVKMQF